MPLVLISLCNAIGFCIMAGKDYEGRKNVIRDYHMHPQIITKPELFAQFVETARKNGIEEICITDHMPLIGSSLKDRLPADHKENYPKVYP